MIRLLNDCAFEGHDWVLIGEAPDGTVFFRCRACGKESEE